MSVSHFIPSALSMRSRVKPREIPVTLRFPQVGRNGATVTADRTPAVGAPTDNPATIAADDPLVGEAVTTGFESLAILERRARHVVRELRWRRLSNGRLGLAELVHGTQALVMLAASTALAIGEDLDLLGEAEELTASETTRRAVNEIIAAQMAEDWSAVADAIEKKFLTALSSWRAVFGTIDGLSHDSDPGGHAA